ncbi:hypothetical protein BDN72DRAFT_961521 [Pluteus cervinus]|uniref:Uncharacterized protein n=1 Tax=Pluteus cervinus TaxID=181527 RepID=A0ACD3AMH2_9AGAR|nr:hypothetical protein BDN72DRAFT_961521 [Pluteus cervinus]
MGRLLRSSARSQTCAAKPPSPSPPPPPRRRTRSKKVIITSPPSSSSSPAGLSTDLLDVDAEGVEDDGTWEHFGDDTTQKHNEVHARGSDVGTGTQERSSCSPHDPVSTPKLPSQHSPSPESESTVSPPPPPPRSTRAKRVIVYSPPTSTSSSQSEPRAPTINSPPRFSKRQTQLLRDADENTDGFWKEDDGTWELGTWDKDRAGNGSGVQLIEVAGASVGLDVDGAIPVVGSGGSVDTTGQAQSAPAGPPKQITEVGSDEDAEGETDDEVHDDDEVSLSAGDGRGRLGVEDNTDDRVVNSAQLGNSVDSSIIDDGGHPPHAHASAGLLDPSSTLGSDVDAEGETDHGLSDDENSDTGDGQHGRVSGQAGSAPAEIAAVGSDEDAEGEPDDEAYHNEVSLGAGDGRDGFEPNHAEKAAVTSSTLNSTPTTLAGPRRAFPMLGSDVDAEGEIDDEAYDDAKSPRLEPSQSQDIRSGTTNRSPSPPPTSNSKARPRSKRSKSKAPEPATPLRRSARVEASAKKGTATLTSTNASVGLKEAQSQSRPRKQKQTQKQHRKGRGQSELSPVREEVESDA